MNTLDFEPAPVTLRLREGAKLSFPLEFKDSAGDPLDVTGRTFEAELADPGDPDGAAAVAATFDYTAAATGTVTVELDASSLSAGQYVWDLWETTGTQQVALLAGPVLVSARVT